MTRRYPSGGFIFACIINYFEFIFIWAMLIDIRYALITALVTLVIMYALVSTPVSDYYYIHKLNIRLPNEKELKRITPIRELVVRRAEENNIKIPETVQIYVMDSNEKNAFAVGRNIIVIHTAMLMGIVRDDEIGGVLGHELGHIVNGDTVSLLMSIQGSIIFDIILLFFKGTAWILEGFTKAGMLILGTVWSEGNLNGGILAVRIVNLFFNIIKKIIDLSAGILIRLETAGYMLFGRQDEFEADRFSVSMGLGKGLKDFLCQVSVGERVNKFSLEYILQGTHPPTSERIQRIELIMRQLEDGTKEEEPTDNINNEALIQNDMDAEIIDKERKSYSVKEQFQMAIQCIQDGDEQQGIVWLERAVLGEYPKAYIELGRCYLYGIGVSVNKSEAVRYLKKAIELEDAEGIYLLAECYASVKAGDKYSVAAFKCYYKSAQLGYNAAIAKVGLCYLEGKGIEKNERTAYQWLKIAVEKRNYQKASYSLAKCYINGIGTSIDVKKGIEILKKGIAQECDEIDKARCLLEKCMSGEAEGIL